MKSRVRAALLILGLGGLPLTGCMTAYLAEQGMAQVKVLTHRVPVEEALPTLPPEKQAAIRLLQEARVFGLQVLDLPVEGVYETYSGYNSDPIWNVSACPRDSLTPYLWKYPVLGPLPYIGFYQRADAEKEKQRLLELGYDVQLYGAGAFSSLGWFSDPIVPSMLRYRSMSLVNTTLHESAHRYLFFRHFVDFNESFASFVGDYGTAAFYVARDGTQSPDALRALGERRDGVRFGAFIQKAVARVEALYQRPELSREEKLKEREVLFKALQAESLALGLETDAYSSFATRPLDNAVLLSYRRYSSGQELFDALYEHCGGNLASAMKIVKTLDPARARGDARRQSPFERLEQWLKDGGSCSPSP